LLWVSLNYITHVPYPCSLSHVNTGVWHYTIRRGN